MTASRVILDLQKLTLTYNGEVFSGHVGLAFKAPDKKSYWCWQLLTPKKLSPAFIDVENNEVVRFGISPRLLEIRAEILALAKHNYVTDYPSKSLKIDPKFETNEDMTRLFPEHERI